MYICYAQIPLAGSQSWYARTLQSLQILNPKWHFQINSPGEDHYVDAGPVDCEITPNEGPYVGQCPLHLQVAKQSDGTAKIYFIMNSLSSPYLLKHAPDRRQSVASYAGGCMISRNLKRIEARTNAKISVLSRRGGDSGK
jgi:hypothetical protein